MAHEARPVTRREFGAAAAATALGGLAATQPASAQESGDVLRSELLMDIELDTQAPQVIGSRQVVPVTGGTFTGPKLKGTALPGGGDWIRRRPDGVSELSVRVTLRTDDEQLIYLTYQGLLYAPAGAPQGTLYWRTTPVFETGAAKYEWLTKIVTVGVGRRVPNKAAYRIFQIL